MRQVVLTPEAPERSTDAVEHGGGPPAYATSLAPAGDHTTSYRAEVNPERTGYPVMAVVRLKYPGPGTRHQPLRRLLEERSEILEWLRTTGDDCYVMKVAATSMAHLEEIVDELAEFGSTTTNLVLSRTLPLRGPGVLRVNTVR
jgi:Lrp/AsnC family leucine-responsive transcriptional regulator